MPVDSQRHTSSSSEVKNAERSSGSQIVEHKEASSSSRGAGIDCNAMLLGLTTSRQQQQQQMAPGSSALQQRLAELSQSLSTSIDVQSASTVNTELAALLGVITAAINWPAAP